jgi:hypothetical protein
VRGEPLPRGGERPEPNPAFLLHAERLSELYVQLATVAPSTGLRLRRFLREGAAREVFRVAGRERAIAPDALIELHDETGRRLLGWVELDLGTMSHTRLKTKAAGYSAYVAETAWQERHPFCPCLLFLTTTETRALRFLQTLQGVLEKQRRSGFNYYSHRTTAPLLAAGACPYAHDPQRALTEACWDNLTLSSGGLNLADCLNGARTGYDAVLAERERERQATERARAHLRSDPEARRAHLRKQELRLDRAKLAAFGDEGVTALALLLARDEPMDAVEQAAFAALRSQLADDPLKTEYAETPEPPNWTDEQAVARLAEQYKAQQQARLRELIARFGEGPRLRAADDTLRRGELLGSYAWDSLDADAHHDRRGRAEQERLRFAYLARRDRELHLHKRDISLATRIARGRDALYELVDRELLRICSRCQEVVYPPEQQSSGGGYGYYSQSVPLPSRCHFCGNTELEPWDERYQAELDYGAGTNGLAGTIGKQW